MGHTRWLNIHKVYKYKTGINVYLECFIIVNKVQPQHCKIISVIFTKLNYNGDEEKNADSENLTNEPKTGDPPVPLLCLVHFIGLRAAALPRPSQARHEQFRPTTSSSDSLTWTHMELSYFELPLLIL